MRTARHWNRPIARDQWNLEPLPLVWSTLRRSILRDQTLTCHLVSGSAQQSLWSNVWLRTVATRVCPIEDIKSRLNHLSVKYRVNCPVPRVLWDFYRKQRRKGGLRVSRPSHQPLRPCFRSKTRNMLALGDEAAVRSISRVWENLSWIGDGLHEWDSTTTNLYFKLFLMKHGRKTILTPPINKLSFSICPFLDRLELESRWFCIDWIIY